MQRLVGKPYVELILTYIDHWMSLISTAGRWEPTHLNFPVRHAVSLQLRIRRQCAYGIASSHVRFSDVAGMQNLCDDGIASSHVRFPDFRHPTFFQHFVRRRCLLLCSEAKFWGNCLRLMRVISSRLIRSWSIPTDAYSRKSVIGRSI